MLGTGLSSAGVTKEWEPEKIVQRASTDLPSYNDEDSDERDATENLRGSTSDNFETPRGTQDEKFESTESRPSTEDSESIADELENSSLPPGIGKVDTASDPSGT